MGTIVSAAVVCTLANTVAGAVLATMVLAMGMVPPCASQLVNCGAMAMTRPAMTSSMASTFTHVLGGPGGVRDCADGGDTVNAGQGHSTVMWPSFTPMLHVNT